MLKRRLLAAFTALAAALTAAVPQLASAGFRAAGAQTGDINFDSAVDTADILLLQEHLTNASPLSLRQRRAADMDGDGSLGVLDLSLLKRQLLHNTGDEKFGGLLINEVCSSNQKSLSDASGAEPDWIEIYNSSGKAMSLDGIGISDGAKNKFKYTFPTGTVIPADGYIIVFCDDGLNPSAGEHHAPFKLSAAGETIYLTHPQYGEIDSVAVPELDTDTSYGRYANGTENFSYLTCTPGKSNDSASDLRVVEKPLFSAEGGFYDAAFDLALSDPNGNAIYYTTDGSDPTTSDTAKRYSGVIDIYNNTSEPNVWSAVRDISLYGYNPPSARVDKGIVIRAVCKNPDGRYSSVATNSYFVGKTASYYSDMKVVSLTTDPDYLFDADTGAYMVGSGYYEWKNSSEYVKYDSGDTKNPTNYNKEGRESEFPVNVQVFENGKLEYTSDVGARIAGNWTRAMPQKSIRLYARSEYGDSKMKYAFFEELYDESGNLIEEFDKVTLNNGGNDNTYLHFRDALIQELTQSAGLSLDYMASEPCILFIDGEFWGFYLMREKVDGDYIEAHYGIDKDNAVVIKNGSIEEGTDADTAEFDELCKWASSADMTSAENYQKFCDSVDIESFMDYIAVETYINNSDWAPDYLNNWIVWKSRTVNSAIPGADGKWRFVLYDTDGSAGIYGSTETSYSYDLLNNMYRNAHWCSFPTMFYNVMNNQDFRERFYENYVDVIENCFDTKTVNALINKYVAAYKPATLATHDRFNIYWYKSYEDELSKLTTFFNNRPSYARKYLDKLYGTVSDTPPAGTNLIADVSRWTHYGTAEFTADSESSTFTVNTPAAGAQAWDIQSQANGIALETGKTYLLTFEAACSTPTDMTMGIIRYESGKYPGCWYGSAALTSTMQEFTYAFTMEEAANSDWFLYFNYAGAAGEFTIRNACLTEVSD